MQSISASIQSISFQISMNHMPDEMLKEVFKKNFPSPSTLKMTALTCKRWRPLIKTSYQESLSAKRSEIIEKFFLKSEQGKSLNKEQHFLISNYQNQKLLFYDSKIKFINSWLKLSSIATQHILPQNPDENTRFLLEGCGDKDSTGFDHANIIKTFLDKQDIEEAIAYSEIADHKARDDRCSQMTLDYLIKKVGYEDTLILVSDHLSYTTFLKIGCNEVSPFLNELNQDSVNKIISHPFCLSLKLFINHYELPLSAIPILLDNLIFPLLEKFLSETCLETDLKEFINNLFRAIPNSYRFKYMEASAFHNYKKLITLQLHKLYHPEGITKERQQTFIRSIKTIPCQRFGYRLAADTLNDLYDLKPDMKLFWNPLHRLETSFKRKSPNFKERSTEKLLRQLLKEGAIDFISTVNFPPKGLERLPIYVVDLFHRRPHWSLRRICFRQSEGIPIYSCIINLFIEHKMPWAVNPLLNVIRDRAIKTELLNSFIPK